MVRINILRVKEKKDKKMKEVDSTLYDLEIGQKGRVKKLQVEGNLRRRLLDLGLVEDTEVVCVGKSPKGDPCAYRIRGAVIAIRHVDSKNIMLYEKE